MDQFVIEPTRNFTPLIFWVLFFTVLIVVSFIHPRSFPFTLHYRFDTFWNFVCLISLWMDEFVLNQSDNDNKLDMPVDVIIALLLLGICWCHSIKTLIWIGIVIIFLVCFFFRVFISFMIRSFGVLCVYWFVNLYHLHLPLKIKKTNQNKHHFWTFSEYWLGIFCFWVFDQSRKKFSDFFFVKVEKEKWKKFLGENYPAIHFWKKWIQEFFFPEYTLGILYGSTFDSEFFVCKMPKNKLRMSSLPKEFNRSSFYHTFSIHIKTFSIDWPLKMYVFRNDVSYF